MKLRIELSASGLNSVRSSEADLESGLPPTAPRGEILKMGYTKPKDLMGFPRKIGILVGILQAYFRRSFRIPVSLNASVGQVVVASPKGQPPLC